MLYQILKLAALCCFLALGVFADEALSGKKVEVESEDTDDHLACACKKKKRISRRTSYEDVIIVS